MVEMVFPATLRREADGVTVTFRDIPEAITGAPTTVEALALARDALTVAIAARLGAREPIPAPTRQRLSVRGQSALEVEEFLVSPEARVAAKALVLHLMQARDMKAGRLAERLGVPASEIVRLLDPTHRTSLDRLEQAVEALGVVMRISAAGPDEHAAEPANTDDAAAAVGKIMADAERRILERLRNRAARGREREAGAGHQAQPDKRRGRRNLA